MQIITVNNNSDQIFKTTLGGASYKIRLIWQDFHNFWFISLFDANTNAPILQNRRIQPDILIFDDLLTPFVGDLVAFSRNRTSEKINRNDFGENYFLYYLDQSDINALIQ